ncbi:hypothetical protein D3C80_1747920 [compost metagenome]
MHDIPSNAEIAHQIGISEAEVAHYREETFRLGDGSWLVHFAFAMPMELRQRLTGSFTFILKATPEQGDARQNNWI